MLYNIAVVGATGNTGKEVLKILIERNFPFGNLYAVASPKSKGKKIQIELQEFTIESVDEFDFSKTDIIFTAVRATVAKDLIPKISSSNSVIIDLSSYFRMDNEVPLIVADVNPEDVKKISDRKIISNPNCVFAQIAPVIKAVKDKFKITDIIVSSYQSVSGKGKDAMNELYSQTQSIYEGFDQKNPEVFNKQISFNCIPVIGDILSNNDTDEEQKIREEIKKVFDKDINVMSTCVRVPVFNCHGVALTIDLEKDTNVESIINALKDFGNTIQIVDKDDKNSYVTQIECIDTDVVFVSRIRQDVDNKKRFSFWIVADNLRKGAALNAVQIAELIFDK